MGRPPDLYLIGGGMYIEKLIRDLIKDGGALVLSSECSFEEIYHARKQGRFAIFPALGDATGFGIVRRSQEWLDETKNRAREDKK